MDALFLSLIFKALSDTVRRVSGFSALFDGVVKDRAKQTGFQKF